VEEKCLLRIKEFVKEHKKLTVAIIIVAILAFIVAQMIFADWLFRMRFEGWWMLNKAGVNIWDITFEKG
jgi:flagellar basal body-associated protein FliL